jgi:predicted secreted hydrolase
MDHEFGSAALRETQQGWDWYSIQLDNDSELMLYVIRRVDGSPDITSSGSLIGSDGEVIPIRRD